MLAARLPRVSVRRVLFQGDELSRSDPLPEVTGTFLGEGGVAEPKATEMDYTQEDPRAAFAYVEP